MPLVDALHHVNHFFNKGRPLEGMLAAVPGPVWKFMTCLQSVSFKMADEHGLADTAASAAPTMNSMKLTTAYERFMTDRQAKGPKKTRSKTTHAFYNPLLPGARQKKA